MEYFDNKVTINELDKLKHLYKYTKYISILTLFIFNNAIYGFNHGDLHRGNYFLNEGKTYKLYVIDYGYCYPITEDLFYVLYQLFNNTNKDTITIFYEYLLNYNKVINKGEIRIDYNRSINIILKEPYNTKYIVSCLIDFSFKHKLILPCNLLNTLLLFTNLADLLNSTTSSIQNKPSWELLNICESYNTGKYYIEFINKYNFNDYKECKDSIFNDNFNKFENLKKYLLK